MKRISTLVLVLSAFQFFSFSAFPQGSLTPPGPPAPIMKTLDQLDAKLEKRIPIDATNTPGDANYEFIVTQPGSYYFPGNIGVAKTNGIRVTVSEVTIDLQGFRLFRSGGAGGNGVEIPSTAHDFVLENGSISGFANGTSCPDGVGSVRAGTFRYLTASNCSSFGLQAGNGWRVENCSARDNAGAGMLVGNGSVVKDCAFTNNAGLGGGLATGSECVIAHCNATANLGNAGIGTGSGCTVSYCVASANSGSTASSAGFFLGDRSTIVHCAATDNGSSFATPSGSTGAGISASGLSLISDCIAVNNKGDGIRVASRSKVIGNKCDLAGTFTGNGAGIHATGNNSRIENNDVTNSTRGIDISGVNNLIIKNSASGNTTNYNIASGNSVGPIVTAATNASAITSNSAPSTLNSVDPWANFSY
jgi:parallel beta-helix repeat protein